MKFNKHISYIFLLNIKNRKMAVNTRNWKTLPLTNIYTETGIAEANQIIRFQRI